MADELVLSEEEKVAVLKARAARGEFRSNAGFDIDSIKLGMSKEDREKARQAITAAFTTK